MADFWNPNENDENQGSDAEEEESTTSLAFGGREGVIFLIDADPSITQNPEAFKNCIECIEACMLRMVISSQRNLIGVVFYNTIYSPKPKNDDEHGARIFVPKNTAIFIPLGTTSKDMIQYLKHFKVSEDFFDFKNQYGSEISANSLSEALWLCSRMFMQCDYKLKENIIILFTNNERPYPNGSHELQKAFTRAKDLRELGVHMILTPTVDDFNSEPFYREFLCTAMDEDPETWQMTPPAQQRAILLSRHYKRDYRRQCHRYFNLTIADGFDVSVGIYCFKTRTFTPMSIKMLRDSNKILTGRVCWKASRYDDDLEEDIFDQILLPGELRKYQEFGGQKILFSSDELSRLKGIISPGMRLLGFKPMITLPDRCYIRSTQFLYPNEKSIRGSATLFRALWEKCLEKDVYIMCVFTQVRKSPPAYIALVPQQQDLDGNDGFRVVYLPTQTHVKTLNMLDQPIPDVSQKCYELMKKTMKKLRFKYSENLFENPYFQMFYSNMEALVFDEEPVTLEDSTMPDIERQDSQIGPLIDEITENFGTDLVLGKKRPAASKPSGEQGSKIPKTTSSAVTRYDIESAITSGAAAKLTVAVLKDFLRSEGVEGCAKLTKAALIEKIKRHLNIL